MLAATVVSGDSCAQIEELVFLLIAFFTLYLNASAETASSPRKVQFVTAEQDVQLEVLDWGESGRLLIFLAGSGDTGHRFDNFAPQFIAHHHVYGITRRGSGASSKATPTNCNYSADHLGDGVVLSICGSDEQYQVPAANGGIFRWRPIQS